MKKLKKRPKNEYSLVIKQYIIFSVFYFHFILLLFLKQSTLNSLFFQIHLFILLFFIPFWNWFFKLWKFYTIGSWIENTFATLQNPQQVQSFNHSKELCLSTFVLDILYQFIVDDLCNMCKIFEKVLKKTWLTNKMKY